MLPRYRAHIFICLNERPKEHAKGCCVSKGSRELYEYMQRQFKTVGISNIRINKSGCLGQCMHGPAMVIYPEGIWYSFTSNQDIDDIIHSHFIKNKPIRRLFIK